MDANVLHDLLTTLKDAVRANGKHDDVALPLFNPEKTDNGAEPWCCSIEKLGKEFSWSSIHQAAKAGKALRGSALSWFESWEPETERDWVAFRKEIVDLYPAKKNLSEKLTKAVLFNSDAASTYCEYAREKIRLLRNCKVSFTEPQVIELVCGGIQELNVRTATLNSTANTASDLITLLSAYTKLPRGKPYESTAPKRGSTDRNNFSGPGPSKRFRPDNGDGTCFTCGRKDHFARNCPRNMLACSFCNKRGHKEEQCFSKQRSQQNNVAIGVNTVQNA